MGTINTKNNKYAFVTFDLERRKILVSGIYEDNSLFRNDISSFYAKHSFWEGMPIILEGDVVQDNFLQSIVHHIMTPLCSPLVSLPLNWENYKTLALREVYTNNLGKLYYRYDYKDDDALMNSYFENLVDKIPFDNEEDSPHTKEKVVNYIIFTQATQVVGLADGAVYQHIDAYKRPSTIFLKLDEGVVYIADFSEREDEDERLEGWFPITVSTWNDLLGIWAHGEGGFVEHRGFRN